MMFNNGIDTFETGCELIDVTSNHRPDTGWRTIDGSGHEHRWYVGDQPASRYTPSETFETPTLKWVFERWGYWEDGERYAIGHHECVKCGEHVEPRYTADTTTQHIPGLRWCRINGQPVSPDEFKLRLDEARRG